jgi:hypothetical protein
MMTAVWCVSPRRAKRNWISFESYNGEPGNPKQRYKIDVLLVDLLLEPEEQNGFYAT